MSLKKPLLFLIVFLPLCVSIVNLWAFQEDTVSLKYSYYSDNRSIFFDNTEGITVHSPVLSLVKGITDTLSLHAKGSMDAVSAASRRIDAVTTASPKAELERRFEENVGLTYQFRRLTTFDFGLGYSGENDYLSRYGYFSLAHEMFNKNTTLNLDYSHNNDRIYTTRIGDDRSFPKGRVTDSYTINLAQVLSRTTIAALGYNFINARGYMGASQNVVSLAGGLFADERHPERRHRNAMIFRINQFIRPTRSAFHLTYRYYFDDWDVNSHDMGIKGYQYLTDDLILRLRYRYYRQSEAFFWRDNPVQGQEFTTRDGRLQKMRAHLFGMKVIYDLGKVNGDTPLGEFLKNTEVDLLWDRYYRDTGFNYNLFQAGLRVKF